MDEWELSDPRIDFMCEALCSQLARWVRKDVDHNKWSVDHLSFLCDKHHDEEVNKEKAK